jgi:hypothetical protein
LEGHLEANEMDSNTAKDKKGGNCKADFHQSPRGDVEFLNLRSGSRNPNQLHELSLLLE